MDKIIKNKKVLVTGSTGLTGSETVKLFQEKGWDVVGVDNNQRAKLFGTPAKFPEIDMDIRDPVAMETLFTIHKFDAVIHTAAQPSHDYSKDNVVEDFTINTIGTLVLLEATRKLAPEAVFVNVSSDKVYGKNVGNVGELWDETVPLDRTDRTPFGVSKLAADLYVQEYARCFGLKTVTFRPGCITGGAHEGALQHGFLAYLVKAIQEGITYKINGFDGEQVRDQIHARDLASAFYEFIQDPKAGEVYNIGGGLERAKTLKEFAKIISDKVGKPFISEKGEERWADRKWDVHDVSKFKAHYPNWKYEYSLDEIINDLCQTID
jgi:CDP-paratose 2-epimerase